MRGDIGHEVDLIFAFFNVSDETQIFGKGNCSCESLRKSDIGNFHDARLRILVGTKCFGVDIHRGLHRGHHAIDVKRMIVVIINDKVDILAIWIFPNLFFHFKWRRDKGEEIQDWIYRFILAADAAVFCNGFAY